MKSTSRAWPLVWGLALVLSLPVSSRADTVAAADALPQALEGVSIDDRPGVQVPTDVRFLDQDGRTVTLADYLTPAKPLVLALAYYECPMLCTLVLNGMVDGLSALPWTAGKDYRVLVVSVAPKEGPSLARRKRDNYLREYGRLVDGNGFDFATIAPGQESEVKRLAEAVGFHYRFDPETEQYVHAAGLFILTPDGRLSQTLYGIEFPRSTLKLALAEASVGHLGTAWDRVLLYCYHYDPDARGYVLHATRLMRLAGGATVAILGIVLLGLWRRDLKRAAASRSGGVS